MSCFKPFAFGLLAAILLPFAALHQALPDLGGKTVVIVTENAYFPLQFVDAKTQQPVGWEYDAMEALSSRTSRSSTRTPPGTR